MHKDIFFAHSNIVVAVLAVHSHTHSEKNCGCQSARHCIAEVRWSLEHSQIWPKRNCAFVYPTAQHPCLLPHLHVCEWLHHVRQRCCWWTSNSPLALWHSSASCTCNMSCEGSILNSWPYPSSAISLKKQAHGPSHCSMRLWSNMWRKYLRARPAFFDFYSSTSLLLVTSLNNRWS